MKLVLALLVCLAELSTAHAVNWPILKDVRVTSCKNNGDGVCSSSVWYWTSGSQLLPMASVGTPDYRSSLYVVPIGVHCDRGNSLEGRPFQSCSWATSGHAPALVGKCMLRDTNSWELTWDSTCAVDSTWGGHGGAGPGGECVVFTNSPTYLQAVNTPMGRVSALDAANSGNRYCYKPLPPNVQCELSLPTIIDHGEVRVGQQSKRDDDGHIDCGGTPKIDVLVNGNRDVNGVRISATPRVLNPRTVRITSEIRVSSSATVGEHSATYVFVASPY